MPLLKATEIKFWINFYKMKELEENPIYSFKPIRNTELKK